MTSIDFRSSSRGGMLMDGTGDIAYTVDALESKQDITRSRLRAALDGFQLYPIGAGLNKALGQANSNEVEVVLKRRTVATLTNGFMPSGSFTVRTLRLGDAMTVFVYNQDTLLASATVSAPANSLEVK